MTPRDPKTRLVRWAAHALSAVWLVGVAGCAGAQAEASLDLRKSIASRLVAKRDWDSALRLVREMHVAHPDDPEVLLLRGIIHRERGMYGLALEDLDAALAEDDDLHVAHSAKAVLLDRLGRHDAALVHHERASELAPEDPAYLNNVGFALWGRKRTREAVEILREALRIEPTNARILNNLGFALADSGDFTSAWSSFERAGTPAQARNNLGFAYERGGNLARALDLYREAVALTPDSPTARANLRHVAHLLGKAPDEDAAAPEETQ